VGSSGIVTHFAVAGGKEGVRADVVSAAGGREAGVALHARTAGRGGRAGRARAAGVCGVAQAGGRVPNTAKRAHHTTGIASTPHRATRSPCVYGLATQKGLPSLGVSTTACNAGGCPLLTWLSVFADAAHRNVPPSVAASSAGSMGAWAMRWPAAVVSTTSPLSLALDSSKYMPGSRRMPPAGAASARAGGGGWAARGGAQRVRARQVTRGEARNRAPTPHRPARRIAMARSPSPQPRVSAERIPLGGTGDRDRRQAWQDFSCCSCSKEKTLLRSKIGHGSLSQIRRFGRVLF
jgi:hypothetical protein